MPTVNVMVARHQHGHRIEVCFLIIENNKNPLDKFDYFPEDGRFEPEYDEPIGEKSFSLFAFLLFLVTDMFKVRMVKYWTPLLVLLLTVGCASVNRSKLKEKQKNRLQYSDKQIKNLQQLEPQVEIPFHLAVTPPVGRTST